MITRYVKAIPTIIDEADTGGRFPKLVILENDTGVAADGAEWSTVIDGLPPDTVVWEPQEDLEDLVFGRDFDTCVFSTYSYTTKIVKRRIPAPVLNGDLPQVELDGVTNPTLEWTNAYQIPTQIWRTDVYATTTPESEFHLIAEIPGTSTPGGTVTYTDASIDLNDENEGASYFVVNANGTSNIVEFIGDSGT